MRARLGAPGLLRYVCGDATTYRQVPRSLRCGEGEARRCCCIDQNLGRSSARSERYPTTHRRAWRSRPSKHRAQLQRHPQEADLRARCLAGDCRRSARAMRHRSLMASKLCRPSSYNHGPKEAPNQSTTTPANRGLSIDAGLRRHHMHASKRHPCRSPTMRNAQSDNLPLMPSVDTRDTTRRENNIIPFQTKRDICYDHNHVCR